MPFIKLIRPINLLIMMLTEILTRHCIISPFFRLNDAAPAMGYFDFALLVLSTLLIAAGGYIINDYYDSEKDKINKPESMIIGKEISHKSALKIYLGLTGSGILTGFYISYKVDYQLLGFVFLAIALMLWFYTTNYQKTALTGNVVIGLLSAMVIVIVWIFEFFALRSSPLIYAQVMNKLGAITPLITGYSFFAFLVSVIREILKDCEDAEGDKKAGFRTCPVVKGIKTAGQITALTGFLCILLLGYAQHWLFIKGFDLVFWYLLIVVQPFLFYLVYLSLKASSKEEFRFAANTAKITMVAGILSMQLFCISI
ncbi:MAG: geranylgeranylglycerol-phosphate geranylgeranyltransferase [Bacteroidales bacterium]|nr:geranylgeranylglycerol-phosphate geranylgeranyltransferase [Bacteroidales bacterium]